MKRYCLFMFAMVWVVACEDARSPITPDGGGRITETSDVTAATLRSDGSLEYQMWTLGPRIKTSKDGPLEARVVFNPVPGCDFNFSLRLPILLGGGNLVFDTHGTGPELSLQGNVDGPGDYFFYVRRTLGTSCSLPEQGMPFPHTIIVTHP